MRYNVNENVETYILKIPVGIFNRKVTVFNVVEIEGVEESEYNNRRYLWLKSRRAYFRETEENGVTYITIVSKARFLWIFASSGSWKNTHFRINALYDAKTNKMYVFSLKINASYFPEVVEAYENVDFEKVHVDIVKLAKEINEAGFTVSQSKPVHNYIAYMVFSEIKDTTTVVVDLKKELSQFVQKFESIELNDKDKKLLEKIKALIRDESQ